MAASNAKNNKVRDIQILNRELSWLSFNHRVLQEAQDPQNPLLERARFLGIFSNNLDEFFRVRVATLKRMERFGVAAKSYLEMNPKECLSAIESKVRVLQDDFEETLDHILRGLEKEGVFIKNESNLTEIQRAFALTYYRQEVAPVLVPIILHKKSIVPNVEDNPIYLAVRMIRENKTPLHALIEVPTDSLSRFVVLPAEDGYTDLMMLDDVIRLALPEIFHIFEFSSIEAYTIKLTRDAELDISEDISQSLMEKLEKSIQKRKQGEFVRFIYDEKMPKELYRFLENKFSLQKTPNKIAGGRYHNFKDFIGIPSIGAKHLSHVPMPPLDHPVLRQHRSVMKTVMDQDVLLTYPYHSFHYIIDLLREAAIDPTVSKIKINIYRVAPHSKVMNALINAVKNGKKVTVNVELEARFDEENNLEWSRQLEEEGVKVLFGVDGLKVHAKLILIERKTNLGGPKYIAHVGTGNFHEGTAKIYTDYSLLTSDQRIGNEVRKVFSFLKSNYKREMYRYLWVSPFNFRRKLMAYIQQEMKNAQAGLPASIDLKLNNLVDNGIIKKLYMASEAGVKIRILVRGICSLVPGIKGMSSNIQVVSVVGRFLEHQRVFIFHNGGDPKYLISSADVMSRNLDRRVEVACPVLDKKLQAQILKEFEWGLKDKNKGRFIDESMENPYQAKHREKHIDSQTRIYQFHKEQLL